ncbi:MAG: TIGR04086 family membrane protein [Clostridia bacterium]|nr:TIGR04086 family membrane protein [Clostridia bacterium]
MNKNSTVVRILIKLGISLGISTVLSVLLLFIATFALYKTDDPTGMVKEVAYVVLAAVSLIGGGVASRLCDRDYLPEIAFSAISGAVYCLVLFLLSAVPVSSETEGEAFPGILVYLAVTALFTLGGVVGRPREKKRRPYKKKARR